MRTAGSILLLIILVPATVVVFFVTSLKMNVLTARFITHELVARNAYGIAEDQIAEQIGKIDLADAPIATTDLQALARRIFPASWLRQNVESTVNGAFAWFNGQPGTTLSLPVDLRGPKAELIPGVDALIQSAIPRLPVCTRATPADELCRDSKTTVADIKDTLKQGGIDLDTVTTQLPDSIDLADPVLPDIKLGNDEEKEASADTKDAATSTDTKKLDDKKKTEEQKQPDEQKKDDQQEPKLSLEEQSVKTRKTLEDAKARYHDVLRYWTYVLIGYAVLILGFIAINIKGWRRLTRWIGILMVTIGTLPLAIGIASKIIMDELLPGVNIENLPAGVQTAILDTIRDVQHTLFSPILIAGAAMVILGIGAIVGARFIPKQGGHQELQPKRG